MSGALVPSLLMTFLLGFSPESHTATIGYDALIKPYRRVFSEQSITLEYQYDSKSLEAFAGMKANSKDFDFATGFSLFPWQFNNFKFGFTGLYHIVDEKDIFREHDFYVGGDLEFKPVKWFSLRQRIAYYGCFSEIIPLKEFGMNGLYNNSTYLFLRLNFIPVDPLLIFLEASNLEYYKYSFLGSVSFVIGVRYTFPFYLHLGFDLVSRWTDFVTLSTRYDGTDIRIKAGIKWK